MNNLLRDLVVEEKIAVFINNVMIVTEMEEGHDEIVEKVLRRLEENDLFVKPKKYVWKAKEVGFLGVIIGSNGVRMEKKKGLRSGRLASTKEYEGCTEVFEIGKLLQTVCQIFCKDSKTIVWDDEERDKVELGRKAAKSIWRIEEEVYNRASLDNTRLG